jgi:hypothetical protein
MPPHPVENSCPFSFSYVVPKNLSEAGFLRWGVLSPTPNLQAGEPSLVGRPLLLIQCIRSYPAYLEAVSSIRNLRTRRATPWWQGAHLYGTLQKWRSIGGGFRNLGSDVSYLRRFSRDLPQSPTQILGFCLKIDTTSSLNILPNSYSLSTPF